MYCELHFKRPTGVGEDWTGALPSGRLADEENALPASAEAKSPTPQPPSRGKVCVAGRCSAVGAAVRDGGWEETFAAFNLQTCVRASVTCVCVLADEEDKDGLQELAAEQRCFVEHILCTKPLPCR